MLELKGASQLIESDLKDNSNLLELTQLITIESERIISLLNRMDHISNNNSKLECEYINIHEILNHCRRVAQNSFGAKIEYIDEFDPSLPKFLANKNLLIQILQIMIKNM